MREPEGDVEEKERGTRGGDEEEKIFRSSKKTVRSPDVEKGLGGGVEGMMKRLIREELGEVKSWREEVRGWRGDVREEIRGGLREQWEWLKKELEEMRKEFREREEKWREEKEKMEGEIKLLEGRVRAIEEGGGKRGKR